MQEISQEARTDGGVIASGYGAVALGGDNHGSINTGVIVNIHGDGIERDLGIARTILAATLLAPPLDKQRKRAITASYRAIAKTLSEAAQAPRDGVVPYGKCGEMLDYAQQLPAELGDVPTP